MSLESTIRNLLSPASPRKGTAGILSEFWGYDAPIENAKKAFTASGYSSTPVPTARDQVRSGVDATTGGQLSPQDKLNIQKAAAEEARRQVNRDVQYQERTGTSVASPTQLSPEQLSAKLKAQGINKSPQDIVAERENLAKARMEMDKTRPEGQPASFTQTGASPEAGSDASGKSVFMKQMTRAQTEFKNESQRQREAQITQAAAEQDVDGQRLARQQARQASGVSPPTPKPEPTPDQQKASSVQPSSTSRSGTIGSSAIAGSGINTVQVAARQMNFGRQPMNASYDPTETRKSFIRESVLVALNIPK
jgi:hypothetical protein